MSIILNKKILSFERVVTENYILARDHPDYDLCHLFMRMPNAKVIMFGAFNLLLFVQYDKISNNNSGLHPTYEDFKRAISLHSKYGDQNYALEIYSSYDINESNCIMKIHR